MPYQFEDVDIPQGSFISWGPKPGQKVVGKVVEYGAATGTDFNDNPCPQLSVELVEPAHSVNKDGERRDYGVGELVVINGGQANLRRNLLATDPSRGDVISIEFSDLQKTPRGSVKVFRTRIARGAAAGDGPAAPVSTAEPAPPF